MAGPILGAMYSLNGDTLKMSVQFMPLGNDEPRMVRLEVRPAGGPWREATRSSWGEGYTALLRVDEWDSSRVFDYRVRYRDRGASTTSMAASCKRIRETKMVSRLPI